MARIALAWLREDDFPAWKAMDPSFGQEYSTWLVKMERLFQQQLAIGNDTHKVIIEPGEFLRWQIASGAAVDSNARAQFAAWKLAIQKHSH